MFHFSSDDSFETDSLDTVQFETDEIVCNLCRKPITPVVVLSHSEKLYDISIMTKKCYTTCNMNVFHVCGECIQSEIAKSISCLESIRDNAYVFNKELSEYRKFQMNHTCARSTLIKQYIRDRANEIVDNFTFKLAMSTLPDCNECSLRERTLDVVRGEWKSYQFIDRGRVSQMIKDMRKKAINFYWPKSVFVEHKKLCGCDGFVRKLLVD